MKYIKQFVIIMSFAFVGEAIGYVVPLPIPGSIYGIILLFAGLKTGIVPYDSVKDVAHFLIEIMPVMFIPSAVGLITAWDIIRESLFAYIFITVFTTIFVMIISGRVTQLFTGKGNKNE